MSFSLSVFRHTFLNPIIPTFKEFVRVSDFIAHCFSFGCVNISFPFRAPVSHYMKITGPGVMIIFDSDFLLSFPWTLSNISLPFLLSYWQTHACRNTVHCYAGVLCTPLAGTCSPVPGFDLGLTFHQIISILYPQYSCKFYSSLI